MDENERQDLIDQTNTRLAALARAIVSGDPGAVMIIPAKTAHDEDVLVLLVKKYGDTDVGMFTTPIAIMLTNELEDTLTYPHVGIQRIHQPDDPSAN